MGSIYITQLRLKPLIFMLFKGDQKHYTHCSHVALIAHNQVRDGVYTALIHAANQASVYNIITWASGMWAISGLPGGRDAAGWL